MVLPVASAATRAAGATVPITLALSGIFGSISMTAWICLLLFANFKAKSADGLSMAFLIVWLLGDATNLIGALFTQLAPTAVALAGYFCIADVILIAQCVYYNTMNARRLARIEAAAREAEPAEDSPLLRRRSSSGAGLPGSQRRHATHQESSMDPIRKIVTGEDDTPDSNPWLHNTLSLLAVYVIGFAGWFISYKAGAWDDGEPAPDAPSEGKSMLEIFGLVLGYVSAVCYLCARVPQIVKNYREKSCEGLALLFFMLSLTGNMTYGVSLIAYSQEKDYLLNALPWLLGSIGTIVEDCIIFVQFRLYSSNKRADAVVS